MIVRTKKYAAIKNGLEYAGINADLTDIGGIGNGTLELNWNTDSFGILSFDEAYIAV